jgi:hypothetical protein
VHGVPSYAHFFPHSSADAQRRGDKEIPLLNFLGQGSARKERKYPGKHWLADYHQYTLVVFRSFRSGFFRLFLQPVHI